ncbi:glycerol-3-phosphate 1-O-acyltransferase PlsY [bacterium]|nr:glycerol-3-phosphate 1-O-acyltransferase PlsY [bacterium]
MSPAFVATYVIAAYFVGSIPFGWLTARTLGGIDIRQHGSGNIGATNVGRVMGLKYFFLVFLLDMLKGFLPTLGISSNVGKIPFESLTPLAAHGPILVAAAAIVGHNFPVYLKFKGGKGVATSLGAVLALDPPSAGFALFVFVVIVGLTRWVSAASLAATTAFLMSHFASTEEPFGRFEWGTSSLMIGLWAMMIWRHRANLKRIVNGTEPKVGRKK